MGIIENGKYSQNGFYVDQYDHYEGEFKNGGREGYGKYTNANEKYIGNFHQNMYSGQGQILVGK